MINPQRRDVGTAMPRSPSPGCVASRAPIGAMDDTHLMVGTVPRTEAMAASRGVSGWLGEDSWSARTPMTAWAILLATIAPQAIDPG